MLTDRFAAACAFALELHSRQYRKGTSIPYAAHLLAVASLVLEHGGDEDQAIAALLHDALEDQGQDFPNGGPQGLRAALEGQFGAPVLAIVEACTDTDQIPKPPWRARKEAYLAHLPAAPLPVLRVSAADKLHNARSILSDYRALGEGVWSRFSADREQLLWYYRGLLAAFRQAGAPAGLVRELGHTLGQLEDLIVAADPGAA